MTTSAAGFVFKQSSVSKDIRVPSGPETAKLTSNSNPGRSLRNVRQRSDGRVAIRSNGFVPRLNLKSAVKATGPAKYEHVAPPNPADLNPQGWTYNGPDASSLDPNTLAPAPAMTEALMPQPESHDPWNQHPGLDLHVVVQVRILNLENKVLNCKTLRNPLKIKGKTPLLKKSKIKGITPKI